MKTGLFDIKAKDIMSKNLVKASPEEALSDVLGKMTKYDIHEILVMERGKLLGLVSYDVLVKRRSLPLSTKVERIMVPPPKIVETESLPTIAEIMLSSGSRALPVTSDGKPVGIISRSDLINSIRSVRDLPDIEIGEIMSPSPQCVLENDTLEEARYLMKDLDERTVPVINDGGELVGIIGLKDMARQVWWKKTREGSEDRVGQKSSLSIVVGSVMNTPAISLPPSASLSKAIELMARHDISSIVAEKEKRPVGILTQVDVIEYIATFRKEEELYVQITGLEEEPYVYDEIYERIQKSVIRISNIVRPKILNIHVVPHHVRGDVAKYSLRARLSTEKRMYYARSFDWDLMKVLDDVLNQLEGAVKKDKEKRLDERRKAKERMR